MFKPYFRISEVSGVNMMIAANGDLSIQVCVVKAKGNQLEIAKKIVGLSSLRQLKEALPVKVPVALNLVGKGILVKQIEGVEEINANNFGRVLPNAKAEDFFMQQFVAGGYSYISLIRTSEAERWLEALATLGIEVLSLSLGPFVIQHVLPQLNFYGESIVFDGHLIQRDDQANWISYRHVANEGATFPIKLETEKLDEKLVIPYATAFQMILATDLPLIHAKLDSLNTKLKSVLAERKITIISMITLSSLFILLLFNFLLFTHFSTGNNKLALKVGRSLKNVTDVDRLNADIKHKEALLDTLGWDGRINQSVYIDRIAQLLPPEVAWQEIAVNPVDLSRQKEERNIKFLNRKIEVGGYSQKIMLVNEWIGRIKSLGWVKSVHLLNYSYDNEQNTGKFTIIIDY